MIRPLQIRTHADRNTYLLLHLLQLERAQVRARTISNSLEYDLQLPLSMFASVGLLQQLQLQLDQPTLTAQQFFDQQLQHLEQPGNNVPLHKWDTFSYSCSITQDNRIITSIAEQHPCDLQHVLPRADDPHHDAKRQELSGNLATPEKAAPAP